MYICVCAYIYIYVLPYGLQPINSMCVYAAYWQNSQDKGNVPEKEQKKKYKEARSYSEEKMPSEVVKDKLNWITCNLEQSSTLVQTPLFRIWWWHQNS